MAVYKADILDIELNTGNIARSFLCHNIGKDDQKADRFGVRCFRDGEPVSLSGVSIQGFMLRPNGSHFHIHGSANTGVSGNEAWVDLPQEAYDYEGQFCLALKLIGGEVTGTIRIIDGMVNNTFVDGAVAPTAAVPTYQEILSVYDQMVAAKAGSVRFDTEQSLTAAQKTQARGNIEAASERDVSDLKSAIDELNFDTKAVEIVPISHVGYRYGYLDGELISSSGTTAWEFDATENARYMLQGIGVGTENTFAILFVDSSNSVISIINDAVQETGHKVSIRTPSNCVKIKYTSSTNTTWDANPKQITYSSLAEQTPIAQAQTDIADLKSDMSKALEGAGTAELTSESFSELDFETKTVAVTPISHVNYRYGYLDGELISSNGSTAWEFDAEPNRDYVLQGLQVGTNNTYAVLFIDSSNNVISIINDATQETGHLVPIKTPSECVKVKYSSSTNATWDASPKKVVYKTLAEQSSVANSVNSINVIERLIGINYELDDGYLDVSGNLIPPSGNKEVTTSLIPVMAGQIMNVTIEYNQIRNAWCAFCVYDANKTFVKRIADAQESTASKTWTYTVGGNIAYVRLSYRTFNDIKNVSVFFDKSIFERLIPIEQNQNLFRKKYTHLMNRQGEGYGFPDNSIEGITSALNDGFSRIRVSIACTSDNIIYCTHSSEMKNNATSNCLKLDGTTYTENVSINDVTSDFINRLLYKNYIIPTLESVMSLVCAYDVELTLEMKEAFTATQAQTLIDMINYYRIPVVISGLNAEDQLQAIVGISTDMRLGVIFHYTDSLARYSINQFSDKCKSLRFDCFLSDTISRESVTGIIHPNYGLKLGGSNPSASEIKDFLKWVDVCETARPYSEFV